MRWFLGALAMYSLASPSTGQQEIMTEEEFVQQGQQQGRDDGMPVDPRCPNLVEVVERCVAEDEELRGPTLRCLQQVESTRAAPRSQLHPAPPVFQPSWTVGAVERRGALLGPPVRMSMSV